jgi:hypothetical protein
VGERSKEQASKHEREREIHRQTAQEIEREVSVSSRGITAVSVSVLLLMCSHTCAFRYRWIYGRWAMESGRGDWPPRHKLCVKESDGLRRELESTKAGMLFVLEYAPRSIAPALVVARARGSEAGAAAGVQQKKGFGI